MAGKKKRTTKKSQGIHGAKKHPLTPLERVLLGKGLFVNFKVQGDRAK